VVAVASLSPRGADVPLSAQGRTQEPERIAREAQSACGAMMSLELPDVRITEAMAAGPAERGAVRVAHCRVTGVIGREIRFAVWLPNDWNRRFVMGAGNAPERLVARKRRDGVIARTRPLCPYPSRAVYKGSGSTDDEANFVCK
jgi:hypothetical protein